VLTLVSQEIATALDAYLDSTVTPLVRSAVNIAAGFSMAQQQHQFPTPGAAAAAAAAQRAADPLLVAQVHGAVRAMVTSCRTSVIPWLKEQLAEQAASIVRSSLDSRALQNADQNPYMLYSTPHQYAYAAAAGYAPVAGSAATTGASPPAGGRHARKRSSDLRSSGSFQQVPAPPPISRAVTASPAPAPSGGADLYRHLERLCKAGEVDSLQEAIEDALTATPDAVPALLGPQGKARSSLLHTAATLRRPEVCAVLVNLGANPNLANARGLTPVLVALEAGDAASARAMAERGGRLPRQEIRAVEARTGRALDQPLVDELTAPPVENLAWAEEDAANPPLGFSRPGTSMLVNAPGAGSGSPALQPAHGATGSMVNLAGTVAAAAGNGATPEYARAVLMTVPTTKPADATEKQVSKMLDKLIRFADEAAIRVFVESLSAAERQVQFAPIGHSRSTLLFTAAWNRRADLFDLLIAGYGVEANHRNLRRNTALLMSVEQADLEAVQLLLQYGAYATERDLKELEARTGRGVEPAISALLLENYRARKAMGEFDKVKEATVINVKKAMAALAPEKSAFRQDIHKELERHVKFGDPSKVRLMLESLPQASRDAHLGPVGMSKSTLLFTAAWHRRADTCKVLVDCGADINHRNVRRNSAISMAIEQHSVETVNALLECGADSSGAEVREVEKRTNKAVPEAIVEAIFDWCGK
jgi:ankyrin repeat protein